MPKPPIKITIIATIILACIVFTIYHTSNNSYLNKTNNISPNPTNQKISTSTNANQKLENKEKNNGCNDLEFKDIHFLWTNYRLLHKELKENLNNIPDSSVIKYYALEHNINLPWLDKRNIFLKSSFPIYELDRKEKTQLIEIIQSKNTAELLQNSEHYPKNATVEGQLIISWVIELKKDLSYNELDKLIVAGYKLDSSTLFTATKTNLDIKLITLLLDYMPSLDLGKIYTFGAQAHSLSSYAASLGNVKLAKFWQAQGSPITDETHITNLASQVPWEILNEEQAIDLISMLRDSGDALALPISYISSLETTLSVSTLANFTHYDVYSSLSPNIADELKQHGEELKQVNQEINRLISCNPEISNMLSVLENIEGETDLNIDFHNNFSLPFREAYELQRPDSDSLEYLVSNISINSTEEEWQALLLHIESTPINSGQSELISQVFNELVLRSVVNMADQHPLLDRLLAHIEPIPEEFLRTLVRFGINSVALEIIPKVANWSDDKIYEESILSLALQNGEKSKDVTEKMLNSGYKLDIENAQKAADVLLASVDKWQVSNIKHFLKKFIDNGAKVTSEHIALIKNNDELSLSDKNNLIGLVSLYL